MRGLLDALRDPRNSQGLLDMGVSLMAASGPSPVPMNFGQRLAQGYIGSQQMAAERAAIQLRQRQMQLQEQLMQAELARSQAPAQQRIVNMGGIPYYEGGEPVLPGVQMPKEAPKLTDDQREYELAKSEGFKGTFLDYTTAVRRAGASNVNVNTGELPKPPSGFIRPDPNKPGLQEEPGGPGVLTRAQDFRTKDKELLDVQTTFTSLKSNLEAIGKVDSVIDGEKRGRLATSYNNARASLRVLYNTGVLQPGELPLLESALADPQKFNSLVDPRSRAMLKGQIAELEKLLKAQRQTLRTQFNQTGVLAPNGMEMFPSGAPADESDPLGLRAR